MDTRSISGCVLQTFRYTVQEGAPGFVSPIIALCARRSKRRNGYDIRKHETEWFLDLDISLTYGEKVVVVHQEKAGDMVLLGPDVMHWVRAKGKAVCIAWNFILGRAKEMGIYFRNLEAADSNWQNIVPLYWYAQEYVIRGQGEGAVEPGCKALLAKELVSYYVREWEALLSVTDIVWNHKPVSPEAFPIFCSKKGCGKEIINVSFSGYCASCALDTTDHRRASYLLPKEVILEGLKQVMGDDPGLVALTKLSQMIKKMP